jgi:osmotically-inducible protein OsmY
MKTGGIKQLVVGIIVGLASFMFSNCQNGDADIKGDLATKAEQEKNFAGVRFTVENGIVILTGECPTEKVRGEVESKVKGIYGVKKVINSIQIAPVVIGTDYDLKHSVDSVLKKYAGAQALVKDSIVVLEGTVKSNESEKLTTAISSLKPKRIENNLLVKANG